MSEREEEVKQEEVKKEEKQEERKPLSVLDEIEKDYLHELKDLFPVEELADLDQAARIRALRAFKKGLEKQEKKAQKEQKKEVLEKGQPINPLAPPPMIEDHFPTLLEKNEFGAFMADVQKVNSITKITDQIRGRKAL